MTGRMMDGRRVSTLAAAVLVAPAALFFVAAIGRQLQPVQHEPARTLDAIVNAFAALPPTVGVVLVIVAPALALLLAAVVIARTIQTDLTLRADLAVAGRALVPLLRRPTLLVAAAVVVGATAILLFLGVHAIVG